MESPSPGHSALAGDATEVPPASLEPTRPPSPALADTMDSGAPAAGGLGSAAFSPASGTRIGRYELESVLGAGGMGVVYLAADPELKRRVALKLLLHGGSPDPDARVRMLREAQAMARASHPNIVTVHEVGEFRGSIFIAMEFVVGKTLRAWLGDHPRPRGEVIRVLLDAGEGLAAAHEKGLVHRDFKPDNVMVGDDGRVRVMDFGLARASDDSECDVACESLVTQDLGLDDDDAPLSASLTRTGAMLGTPRYMSPEQFAGRPADARADQFAFCLVVWEALYGRPCFTGESLPALATAVTLGRRDPPPPGRGVPRWLRRAVARGLQTNPARRWPSMTELLAAMRADPTRRRLAVGFVGLVAVLAGGAALASHLDERSTRSACEQASRRIDADWNPDLRAQMKHAFLATDLPYATQSFDRAARGFDAYASKWAAERDAVCVATRLEGLRTPEQLQASIDCLEGRRRGLANLVQLLVSEPSAVEVKQATVGIASLSNVQQCSDDHWLALIPALPPGPKRRALISEADGLLADANAAESVASFGRGLELADAAAAKATEANWVATEARAHRTAGVILVHQGKYDDGAARLRKAASLANASGDAALAIEAQTTLMSILIDYLQDLDEAERLSDTLSRMVPQVEPEAGALTLEWHFTTGKLLESRGELDEALRHYDAAAEIAVRVHGPQHPDLSGIYSGQGAIALTRGDRETAAERFAQALAIEENSHGPENPRISIALTNLSIVERDLRRFAESAAHLRRAIEIDANEFGPDHPNVAMGYDAMGGLALAQGRPEDASAHYRSALEILERSLGPEHVTVSLTTANLGRATLTAGDVDEAERRFARALEIREKALGPDSPVLASALRGLADVAMQRDDRKAAASHYQRALLLLKSTRDDDDPAIVELRDALHAARQR